MFTVLSGLNRFFRIPGAWKLLAAMTVYGCGIGILAPMNAIYLKDGIHLSKFEISALVSITIVVNLVVTFLTGLWSDKLRRRKIMPIVASALCVAGLAGYNRADSFLTALLFYVLATTPSGAIVGQLYAMARSHFMAEAPDILEMAVVWLRTLLSVGFFCGLFLGAQLYTMVTFHGVIMGNLVSYVILFFLFLSYKERQGAPVSLQRPEGTRIQWLVLLSILLVMCCDNIRGLYFPLMVDSLYKNPTVVSHLWSIQVIFEFVWMTVGGIAAQRFGDVKVVALGGMSALFVYFIYALHPALPLLYCMQPIYSFFVSVENTVAMAIIQRMFVHRAGFGSSLYFVLGQMASFVGYMLPNIVPGISPSIFFVPIVLMVVALVLMMIRIFSERGKLTASANISA